MDQVSEDHVQKALKNIREKKKVTTVTIAHRLTTIIDSDAIAVIANGKVAELGNHETLLNKEDGIYRLLCESQGITPGEQIDPDADGGKEESVAKGGDVEEGGSSLELAVSTVEVEGSTETAKHESEQLDEDLGLKPVEVASMSSIWKYVGWDGVYTMIGVIGSGIVGALSPCESILTAEIVTTFYIVDPEEMLERNLRYISMFYIFAIASLVGNVMVGIGLSRSGSNLGARLRSTSFRSMLQRSMGWFDENTVGELTTILGADVESVEGLVGLPLGFRVRVLTALITGVCVALAYSWQVGLVAIACVPLIGVAGVLQVFFSAKKTVSESGLSPATILEQGLRGITSVQAYNLEPKVGDDYDTALVPESKGKVREGLITGAVFGFSQMAVFVSFAIVFFVGSLLLVEGQIAFVNFFTAVLAVMFGALGASQVSADFSSRQRGLIAAARVFSTFDGPIDGSEEEIGEESATIKGEIKFSSVGFSYPTRPDFPIFFKSDTKDGVNFVIGEKKSIGLVGRSGSGK